MAISFIGSFILIIGSAVFFCLLCLPIVAAFSRGLQSARDDSHRITSASPWYFFRYTFWRKIRIFLIFSGVFYTLLFLVLLLSKIEFFLPYTRMAPAVAIFSTIFIGFACVFAAACLFWAPRAGGFYSLWIVASISTILPYAFLSIVYVAIGVRMAFSLLEQNHRPSFLLYLGFPCWLAVCGIIVLLWQLRRALRMKDAWFRIE